MTGLELAGAILTIGILGFAFLILLVAGLFWAFGWGREYENVTKEE